MSAFRKLYDAAGIKAGPQHSQIVRREPSFVAPAGGGGPYSLDRAENHLKAYAGGKDGVDWFYDAANVIAKAASTAPFYFQDDAGVKYMLEIPEDADPEKFKPVPPDLAELFTWPNPWMDWQEHVELMIIDLLATGNAFWLKWNSDEKGDKPYSLYRLSPALLRAVPGKGKMIDHFEYGEAGSREAMKIPPEAVVHFRLPNPHSDNAMFGVGAIQAAPQAFDIELGLMEAQRTFFQNGTMLAGTLESDRSIHETSRKKINREFKAMNSGAGSWFKVAFLERGLRYKPIQANAQEAGYEALSKLSRDRIFAMLGVPRILAGIDDGTMKLEEARRMFAEDTMGAFLGNPEKGVPGRLATKLSRQLTEAWGFQVRFEYGYSMPEAERIDVALQLSTLPGIRVREARVKAGLAPLGKDVVDDEGVLIDEYVLNMPGPSTEGEEGSPGGARTGRPADADNVEKFNTSPDSGNRTGDKVNGRRASAADKSRRNTAGVVRPKPAVKAGPITPEALATGLAVFQLPAPSVDNGTGE